LANVDNFYRVMHFSAKRGLAIACRLSVRPSVCNVGGWGPHRLEILNFKFFTHIYWLNRNKRSLQISD